MYQSGGAAKGTRSTKAAAATAACTTSSCSSSYEVRPGPYSLPGSYGTYSSYQSYGSSSSSGSGGFPYGHPPPVRGISGNYIPYSECRGKNCRICPRPTYVDIYDD